MPGTNTDLVIQISTEELVSNASCAQKADEGNLAAELRRCLRPGVEIALVFERYMAITSILWLSGPLPDCSMRACVRLLRVSALPVGYSDAASHRESGSRALALRLESPAMLSQSLNDKQVKSEILLKPEEAGS
jgi:hypothetical protein